MGYYTAYELEIRTADNKSDIIDKAVRDNVVRLLNDKSIIGYALNERLGCYDSVKWYNHDDDMLDISKRIPNVLFCLHGEGDESSDIWDHYFLNGKMQCCQAEIIIPPFDPDQLK